MWQALGLLLEKMLEGVMASVFDPELPKGVQPLQLKGERGSVLEGQSEGLKQGQCFGAQFHHKLGFYMKLFEKRNSDIVKNFCCRP